MSRSEERQSNVEERLSRFEITVQNLAEQAAKLVEPHTLENTLESRLTAEEFRDVLRLDLLVSGEPRPLSNEVEMWLAVEVSSVIDQYDVDRADRRASLLRKAGYRVIPVVTGENITQGAEAVCHDQNVPLLQDGHVKFWNEALSVWAKK